MSAVNRPHRRLRPRSALIRRFVGCGRGAVAVEMALLIWPMIALVIGILQLVIIQYTQVLLNDALYSSAAQPEAELLVPDATVYKTTVCGKIRIMPSATCRNQLIVEMNLLTAYPTAKTDITASAFTSGAAGDAILLRAALPSTRFFPLLPYWYGTAKSSVVFRR